MTKLEPTEENIEKVAREMCAVMGINADESISFKEEFNGRDFAFYSSHWKKYRAFARQAIASRIAMERVFG